MKNFFTLRTMWWGYYEWANGRFIGTEDNWSFGYNMADPRIKDMKPRNCSRPIRANANRPAVTSAQHPVTMIEGERMGSRQIVVEKVRRAGAGRTRHAQIGLYCPGSGKP